MKRFAVILLAFAVTMNVAAQGEYVSGRDSIKLDSIAFFMQLKNLVVFGHNKRDLIDKQHFSEIVKNAPKPSGYSFDFVSTVSKAVNYIPFSIMRKLHIPFHDKERNRQIAKKIVKDYEDIDVIQQSINLRKKRDAAKQGK
ncbi:MAG: hypothetical protein Q4F34_00560 [Prevotellaceae bacterium]|nr:hypothetical protein [Prevotellaceae bacterium]